MGARIAGVLLTLKTSVIASSSTSGISLQGLCFPFVICGTYTDWAYSWNRTHLQDLIETTAQIHYEAFRSKQLLALKENAKENAARPAVAAVGA